MTLLELLTACETKINRIEVHERDESGKPTWWLVWYGGYIGGKTVEEAIKKCWNKLKQ